MNGLVTRFGQVEFDAARGRLAVGGRSVTLDRSSIAILVTLLDEAGKEVGKERLLEAGWPRRVVHENSLAKAIGRLRQALGDDGKALETIHGYGYRLAAETEVTVSPSRVSLPRPHRYPIAALGLAALTAVGVAGVLLVGPSAETQGAVEQPLTRGEPSDAIGRVLWVDDNPQNNEAEKRFLEQRKIAVYQAETTEDALALLAMYDYGAVISDMNREDRPLAGLELVREMRRRRDKTPYYLYTFVPSAAQHARVADAGGQGAAVTSEELYAAILPLFRRAEARPN